MSAPSQTEKPDVVGFPVIPAEFATKVLHAAWMAILLGLLIEAVLLILANVFSTYSGIKPFVADLVQKISWSMIVCVAIALGTAASKLQGAAMGLLGLLAAPIAFLLARGLHKGANQALGLADLPALPVHPLVVGLIKGVEYACLGFGAAWLTKRAWGGFIAHAGLGFTAAVIFGGAILAILQPPWPARFMAVAANELIFPVGCSLVLCAAETLGKKTTTPPPSPEELT